MCVVIICFQVYDVINFESSLIYLSYQAVFLHDQKRQVRWSFYFFEKNVLSPHICLSLSMSAIFFDHLCALMLIY